MRVGWVMIGTSSLYAMLTIAWQAYNIPHMTRKSQLERGVQPGHISERRARGLSDKPFGLRRRLSLSEEGDMLLVVGDNRKAIADMTPKQLHELADSVAGQSNLLLGS